MKLGLAWFGLLCFLCLGIAHSTPPISPSFQEFTLPFTLNPEKEILVDAQLGTEKVKLMIDTGMDAPFALSSELLRKTRILSSDQNAQLHFFGEEQNRYVVVASPFSILLGGQDFPIKDGLVMDEMRSFTKYPATFSGVIGWGFLRFFHIVVNYPDHFITFSNPLETSGKVWQDGLVEGVALSIGGYPVVEGELNHHKVSFLIDTASPQSWVSYEFLQGISKDPLVFPNPAGDMKGVFRVDSLKVDHLDLQNLSVKVMGNFALYSHTTSFQGILGFDVLKGATVRLDASRKFAALFPGSWQPPGETEIPAPAGGGRPAVR